MFPAQAEGSLKEQTLLYELLEVENKGDEEGLLELNKTNEEILLANS